MAAIDIVIVGITGRMGKTLINEIGKQKDFNLLGGVSLKYTLPDLKIYSSVTDLLKVLKPQVIIDFSSPNILDSFMKTPSIPLVIGTTGYTEKEFSSLYELSKTRPVFYSANFSLAVAIMKKTAGQIAKNLPLFTTEIIESHHKTKKDKPSGTALKLAEELKKDTPIHSIRAGKIIGEHEVLFIGDEERLSLKHEAFSRNIFAQGALTAAKFIIFKKNGLYFMEDLLIL